MSGINGRGSGGGGGRTSSSSGSTGVSSIPTGSRKIVQNLKEIVNYPELEIYAMLKECNMDPGETINRLLNQDTFQEVKSKRDKKKEVKDMSEPKARTVNNTANRAPRLGSSNLSSNDYGASRGKVLPKKDNVLSTGPSASILGCTITGNAFSRMPCSLSATSADTSVQLVSSVDGISLSSKPVGVQHAWSVRPGQISMADIVRMGRPQGKLSSSSDVASEVTSTLHSANLANDFQINANPSTSTVLPSESIQELPSHDLVSEDREAIYNPVITTADGNLPHDGQPAIKDLFIENRSKMPLTSISSEILVKPSGASSLHHDDISVNCASYEVGAESTIMYHGEGVVTESDTSDGKELAHSRNLLTLDKASLENTSFYNSPERTFESFVVEDVESEVPSITTNFQHLSIQNDSHGRGNEDDNPAVIFPEHLQVTSAECSHLSFGSFRSGVGTGYSLSNAQEVVNSGLEQTSTDSDTAAFHHMDARITEFYADEESKPNFTENVVSRASKDAEDYSQSSSSQITGVQTDSAHSAHEIQYNRPNPHDHVFSSTTQYTAAEKNCMNVDPTTQNISSLSGVMQAYASSLQSNFLPSNSLPVRELDASYLSLLATQSMPTKYDTGMPSIINQPTISLAETLKSSFLSVSQATQQNLASLESSNIPADVSVPQHLPVHPYSQPALPLGQLANIMGYPFLTPSYTYLPSASFPPTYTDNTAFHQSRSAAQSASAKYTAPQYRNNISLSSLAQNASVPSGYGGIGSSDNISGSFALNPASVSVNTATSFDDILASQYKQGNPYASLQQSEISNMWLGGVSRNVSALPANTYYNLQGQSQHNSGFGQIQQQPSHYGVPGYPNFYHAQVGVPQERQSNPSEVANSNGSHGLPSQPSHHLWQNNY